MKQEEGISIAINIIKNDDKIKSQTYNIARSKHWWNFPWFDKERYEQYIKYQSDNRVLSILIAAITLIFLPVVITRSHFYGLFSPLFAAAFTSLCISAILLSVHLVILILIQFEKYGSIKYSETLRFLLFFLGDWNLSNMLMLISVNTQGLYLLARVVQGQCDDTISIWNSQDCNPVALSKSIPHDVVLMLYLIPLIATVFLKDCSMQSTFLAYFMAMTYISVALSLVDGIVQIYTVIYGLIFILCIFEIERASRLAFLYHQARQDLLHQVLPKEVAHVMTSGTETFQPTEHNEVCCFFSDIVNFTELTIAVGPYGIQKLLDSIYSLMDECVDECDGRAIWKVETIGDAYFCECGVVKSLGSMEKNVDAILKFALLVQSRIKNIINPVNGLPIQLRIGIHCGSCVAGLVGSRRLMPHFSLFGNIVNVTNRIESTGSAGMIHVSNDVVEVATKSFKWKFSKRGIVNLKGIGTKITWWLMSSCESDNVSVDSIGSTVITPHNIKSCPDIFNYNFDVRTVSEDKFSVANNLFIIFDTMFDLEQLVVDRVTLRSFITRIGTLYNDVPYHNFHHALCVTQFAAALYYHNIIVPRAEAGCDIEHYDMNIWKPMFASMIAVMSHDVGHDGFNNSFHNNSSSPLSKTFFGQSPMENNHISITNFTLGMNGCDVFENWTGDYIFFVRNLIANSILATDMRLHDDVLRELSKDSESLRYFFVRYNVDDNSQTDFSDNQYEFMKLARVMLHTADISNSVRPSNISATFVDKLACEFTRQVQEETQLGIPVSTFMVLPNEASKAQGEINFLSKTARPYFYALATIFPHCARLVDSLDENIKYWETIS